MKVTGRAHDLIAGERVITVPQAKLYHWGAGASVPFGEPKPPPFQVSTFSRFHTNRNTLLVLLKNAQHLLLVLVVTHLLSMFAEALFLLVITRNLSLVREAYWGAVKACVKKWPHIRAERRRIAAFRRRGDFWMLRFLKVYRSEKVEQLWNTMV